MITFVYSNLEILVDIFEYDNFSLMVKFVNILVQVFILVMLCLLSSWSMGKNMLVNFYKAMEVHKKNKNINASLFWFFFDKKYNIIHRLLSHNV